VEGKMLEAERVQAEEFGTLRNCIFSGYHLAPIGMQIADMGEAIEHLRAKHVGFIRRPGRLGETGIWALLVLF
jgi:hypothetical protein